MDRVDWECFFPIYAVTCRSKGMLPGVWRILVGELSLCTAKALTRIPWTKRFEHWLLVTSASVLWGQFLGLTLGTICCGTLHNKSK